MNGVPDWVSYHLFYHGSGDRLLTRLVLPALRDLWDQSCILRFFFIRYGLGGPHVRLRLLCPPEHREEVDETVRRAAFEFFTRYPSETRFNEEEIRRRNRHFPETDILPETDIQAIDAVYPNHSVAEMPFHPEVERYGGPGLIPHSLDFFNVSSACALRLVETHEERPWPRRLFHAMRTLLRQALGFAADRDELSRLVACAESGDGPGNSRLNARAEEEFARCREDYVGLVCKEIEGALDPESRAWLADSVLIEASRALGWWIRDAGGPVRWRIMRSQLHMSANRLGLTKLEEIYLGHILRRALEGAAGANAGPLPSLGIPGENALGTLAAACLDRLAGERK